MAAASFSKLENDESGVNIGEPDDAVVFVGISLLVGIACRHLLHGTRVPYTVVLLVIGIGLGSLEYGTSHGLGKIGAGLRLWSKINPDLLLSVFLPVLLFESSFSMEVHQIKKCIMQMLLLAGPGVLISTFCIGTALKLTFPYGWDWKTSLLLGALLGATDPVAVVALLKELGASKKLNTIIEGESLMNDGISIVVYQLFYKMVIGRNFSGGEIVKFLAQVSLGAVALGLAFGIVSVLWLGFIFNDTIIEIALTLAVSYIAYFTAQDILDVSGVLTVMTLGIFYASVGRTAFKGDGQRSLHYFWEMIAYIANTLIFILSGVVIAEDILSNYNNFEGSSWVYLFLLYGFVQLSRAVTVGILFPFLQYFGYGLTWREAIILVWSGLRGAVALSLSLSFNLACGGHNQNLKPEVGALFVFFTGGIVFLTLIVNGSTTRFMLYLLGMDKLTETKVRILNYTRYEMFNKAVEAFGDLGDDEELGPTDWPTVQKYITCLNDSDKEKIHPHGLSNGRHHMLSTNLKDIRIRLLNGVQAAYWGMLEEGRITKNIASILMCSVDEAMDVVLTEPLCDWKGLKSSVQFPSYYRLIQRSRLPRRLVTYFTVERLESACYICAAFLRAHKIARRQLYDFIGGSEVAAIVISESKEEEKEAGKFLDEVRVSFPQILHVVKTRQVTYSVLKHLSDYVKNLEKAGLLNEKETTHLDNEIQTDLKRLLRNPPLVKLPKASDILRTHPLLGVLPSKLYNPLANSVKETITICGITLYKEGSKPNGVWLISVGAVKWSSRNTTSVHSVHPTFSHGNTLGLYEVLTGKPYICDMITDSVVQCFFLATESIQSLLASDPYIEDFLWMESAIVIAKLLHPGKFENMLLHEIRALLSEKSEMKVYLSGEIIEINRDSIGILLEGSIKAKDSSEDLIMAPAALLHSHEESSQYMRAFGNTNENLCHVGHLYHAERRSRVIIFDADAFEKEASLTRLSTSRISLSNELRRGNGREHEGSLSWPESCLQLRKYHSTGDVDKKMTALASRAMDLSMYGSTMRAYGSFRSFGSHQRSSESKPSHSFPFSRTQTQHEYTRPLLPVKSEDGTSDKRVEPKECIRLPYTPPSLTESKQVDPVQDNTNDELGGEEIVVRVDSTSSLSF